MLKGNIETTSIESILQLCNSNGETGKLKFFKDRQNIAVICFKEGEIISAKLLGLTGIDAFVKIFNLVNADFIFVKEENNSIEPEINNNFEFLLLEAISKRDERRKIEYNFLARLKKEYDIESVCAEPIYSERFLFKLESTMGRLMGSDSVVCVWTENKDGQTDMFVKNAKENRFMEFKFNTQVVLEKTINAITQLYKEI